MATPVDRFMLLAARQAATSISTSPTSPPSSTPTSNNNSSSSSSGTSPSLFFIALGIGVVFTNIWIIIGIKYCFRNRHNDTVRTAEEINQELHTLNFYGGPRMYLTTVERNRRLRRPRVKKLLTVEELDQRFPVQLYSYWCGHRVKNGLSAEGGISASAATKVMKVAAAAAAASKVELETDVSLTKNSEKNVNDTTFVLQEQTSSSQENDDAIKPINLIHPINTSNTIDTVDTSQDHSLLDLPDSTGDICAICLENLEPNEFIRALSCHHVFHSDCVTPWLTTRRAICPLCKTDFFSPTDASATSHINGTTSTTATTTTTATLNEHPANYPVSASHSGFHHPHLIYPWDLFTQPSSLPVSTTTASTEHSPPSRFSFWPFHRSQPNQNSPAAVVVANNDAQNHTVSPIPENEPGVATNLNSNDSTEVPDHSNIHLSSSWSMRRAWPWFHRSRNPITSPV